MCMNEKREPNGHFSYPLGNVISIGNVNNENETDAAWASCFQNIFKKYQVEDNVWSL